MSHTVQLLHYSVSAPRRRGPEKLPARVDLRASYRRSMQAAGRSSTAKVGAVGPGSVAWQVERTSSGHRAFDAVEVLRTFIW